VEIVVDQSAPQVITGNITNCTWPLFPVCATLSLTPVTGSIYGDWSGTTVSGTTTGGDASLVSWDTTWSGNVVGSGPTIEGSFTNGIPLTGFTDGSFSAVWFSPL